MITFKTERHEREHLSDAVKSDLRILTLALAVYMEAKHGIDIVVTAVLPEDGISRVSTSHKDGRAEDIRTRDWPKGAAEEATAWLNSHFSTGAYKAADIPMLVAVYHDAGYGPHIHLQVAKGRPLQIIAPSGTLLI